MPYFSRVQPTMGENGLMDVYIKLLLQNIGRGVIRENKRDGQKMRFCEMENNLF